MNFTIASFGRAISDSYVYETRVMSVTPGSRMLFARRTPERLRIV